MTNEIIKICNDENMKIIEIYENAICCKHNLNLKNENDILKFENEFSLKIENVVKQSIIINCYDTNLIEIIF
jgi:hypothetical protein